MQFNPLVKPVVSTPRFNTHRAHATDNNAWAMHRWNIELATVFTPSICDVEVALRNTIHDQPGSFVAAGEGRMKMPSDLG